MTAGTIETIEQDSYSRDFWKREAMKKDKRIKSLENKNEKLAKAKTYHPCKVCHLPMFLWRKGDYTVCYSCRKLFSMKHEDLMKGKYQTEFTEGIHRQASAFAYEHSLQEKAKLEAELESRKTQMEALCEKVNIAEASTLTKDEARGIIKETYNEDYIRYGYEQKQTIRTFLTDFFAEKGVKLKEAVKG